MNSARPGKRQTVPLRPGGGSHRANRNDTPSGVFSVPVTAPSGTGLAGMETRVMGWNEAGGGGAPPYSSTHDRLNETNRRNLISASGQAIRTTSGALEGSQYGGV